MTIAERGGLFAGLREWAWLLRRDLRALTLAVRDPRVPWYAKLTAGATVAYAVSPIDLIPDFIPIIGQLDDMIIVPLGMYVAIRLVPVTVMEELRITAEQQESSSRGGWYAAAAVLSIWAVAGTVMIRHMMA